MSISSATEFMRSIRQDDALRAKVAVIVETASLDDIVAIGEGAGFNFTAEDLRVAYSHDWEMRMMRHRGRTSFKAVNNMPATPQSP
ncbi:Nif11-like leader peptide family natural product precursor [Cerasicoccus frondis]|uniref:Nif11-like leader peptide family natural product precursor n=1 Tax=Cerasicoccus frondis TaxID=490090 RepID=UPI002852C15B|nr:Nif11-like leader peptide family natural product precursor [Cerasicoccus frondis]